MITYHYKCNNTECCHEQEILQSIHDVVIQQCPKCLQSTFERVLYGGAGFSVERNITTLGQASEANARKLGKEQCQKRDEANRLPDRSNFHKINKIIDAGPERTEKYIMEGK